MREPTNDTPGVPGPDPAEGRPDMDLPGADHPDAIDEPPDSPDADLPQRLGDRIENGLGTGIASGEPDLVPDVEVPEETM